MASFGIAEVQGNVQSDCQQKPALEHVTEPIYSQKAKKYEEEPDNIVLNYELSCNWCEIAYELNNKFNTISDECNTLLTDCRNTLAHTQGLKVPYCFEPTKAIFTRMFEDMYGELLYVWDEVSMFPDEVQFYRNMVIEKGSDELSEKSVAYLENVLGYFKDRMDTIREDLTVRQKKGQDMFITSQQVNMPCTTEEWW